MKRRRGDRLDGGDELDDPLFSLLITVVDLGALAGGTLAFIFAVGYAASGRGFGTWGVDLAIVLGLLAAEVALRGWRRHRRLREWRRWHPDEPTASG
jgi:hypothetical protein